MKTPFRKIVTTIAMPILLFISLSSNAAPITYNFSNGGLASGTLIDAEGFGFTGQYQVRARSPISFTLDVGETSTGFSAFTGTILQPTSGSGSGTFFFNNIPMTINGLTQGYNFPGTYSYQIDPFNPTVFTFTSLPDVVFDLGSDGMLVGTWFGNTVTCSATGSCGGGVFPAIEFTRQAAGVPEPATLALIGLGLAGLGFTRRKKV